MARVSLILPVERGVSPTANALSPLCEAMEVAGHEVEVVVALAPGVSDSESNPEIPSSFAWPWRRVHSITPGRAAAAMAGLECARGTILLVLDPEAGYGPDDLLRVIRPLESREASLVVASRWISDPEGRPVRRLRSGIGGLLRTLTGSSDPVSGLVGLTREARDEAAGVFTAVGSQFALELLVKVKGQRDGRSGPAGVPSTGPPPLDARGATPEASGRPSLRKFLPAHAVLRRRRVGNGRGPDMLCRLPAHPGPDLAGRADRSGRRHRSPWRSPAPWRSRWRSAGTSR